jgi:hypothetical protein
MTRREWHDGKEMRSAALIRSLASAYGAATSDNISFSREMNTRFA